MRWWSGRHQKRFEAAVTELESAVGEEIEARLGRYLAAGIATLTTHRLTPEAVDLFEIVPTAPGAARLAVSVSGDEVTVAVGNGVVDFFWDKDREWRRGLGEVLEAVAEGRFHETITKGWIFERKVDMRFTGAKPSKAQYARLSYQRDESQDVPPEIGTRRYPAWDADHAV